MSSGQCEEGGGSQLIARREETAAIRSQVNTAKLLQDNPTLMRLRELEGAREDRRYVEAQRRVGREGLADKVVNLL